jgi:membrane peptidoglycan carboxypeptidase
VSARAAVAAIGAGPAAYGAEADVLDSRESGRGGAGVPRDPADDRARAKRKRSRRRNIVIAGTAVFLMLAGSGIVGGTYFFDDVTLPENLGNLKQSTVVTYQDGTVMARLGDETRTMVTIDQISDAAQHAVVATEDMSFYTNDGVDFKGIARALVNNVTGGERQGASTITQQYAKAVLERSDATYGRKLREAVLAVKIKERYENDKILEMYLNTVYFGRHAYGIEAAAQAYFGKSAKDLTAAEGMVLAGVIKQPVGADGVSGSPYDPKSNVEMATSRFDWIKGNMVKAKYLKPAEAAAMQYPTNVTAYNPKDAKTSSQFGMKESTGLIVHHVMDEMWKLTMPNGEKRFPNIRNGGLKIVTTIDKSMQKAAVDAADPNSENFKKQKFKITGDGLQAALVAVEPGTGQVKAYYGGADGAGTDYAGIFQDPILNPPTNPNAEIPWSQGGAHPPGSSMKVYTMAAGLIAGTRPTDLGLHRARVPQERPDQVPPGEELQHPTVHPRPDRVHPRRVGVAVAQHPALRARRDGHRHQSDRGGEGRRDPVHVGRRRQPNRSHRPERQVVGALQHGGRDRAVRGHAAGARGRYRGGRGTRPGSQGALHRQGLQEQPADSGLLGGGRRQADPGAQRRHDL